MNDFLDDYKEFMRWPSIRNYRPMFQHERMTFKHLAPGCFNQLRKRQPHTTRFVTVTPGLNRLQLPRCAVPQKFNCLSRRFEHPVELLQIFRLKGCVPKFFAKVKVTSRE